MENIQILKSIAENLGLTDVIVELEIIADRLSQKNSEIIVPVVGEFSSGKTTLINAITEGQKLETSSKPTTSVIYEIYFGNEKEEALLFKEDKSVIEIEDISTIKNADLTDVERIRIFDTSKRIDENTILVDTPGLSSNDPKHLEALSKYLPNADALILCIDANQQITNSLLEFIKFNNLAHLPLYLVITKADTKTVSEMTSIKEYILKNIDISADKIISISSLKNELDEFYGLIESIQQNKNTIINNVIDFRLNKTKEYLKEYIKNLLENTASDETIEKELKQQQRFLDRLLNSVNKLIQDTRSEMEEVEYETTKNFSKVISDKLDGIISKNSSTLDEEAIAAINGTSNIMMNNYQNEVRKKLYILANERKNTDLGIPLRSLESVNVEELRMSPLSYDIDLNSAGQEQVKYIANGLKIAAVVGAIAVTAGAAAAAAPAAGASAAASAVGGGVAGGAAGAAVGGAKVAAGAAKVGTAVRAAKGMKMVANAGMAIQAVKSNVKGFKENMNEFNQFNMETGQYVSPKNNQGFVENIVGKVGDSVLGKPQRRKLINDYMESSLIPEFKSNLNMLTNNVLQDIQNNLNSEAQLTISQLEQKLNELKELFVKENEAFKIKIENYKNQLNILDQ